MPHWTAGQDITADTLNDMFLAILRDFAATATVATSETSASTTYTNLATAGPAVTLTSAGAIALVLFESVMYNSTSVSNGTAMSVAVSGATTIAAADADSIKATLGSSGFADRHGGFAVFTITPGSNTYTAKYRASAGTSNWADRKLWVLAP